MNSKGWKLATILLALCCVALTYRLFDQGITRTYLDASMDESAKHNALLANIVEHEWSGLTEDQLLLKLKAYIATQPSHDILLKRDPETNAVYLDGIRFEFKDGKLVTVR